MAETERKSNEAIDSININKEKLQIFSKKYKLNHFYYDSNSDHFFEMSKSSIIFIYLQHLSR